MGASAYDRLMTDIELASNLPEGQADLDVALAMFPDRATELRLAAEQQRVTEQQDRVTKQQAAARNSAKASSNGYGGLSTNGSLRWPVQGPILISYGSARTAELKWKIADIQ